MYSGTLEFYKIAVRKTSFVFVCFYKTVMINSFAKIFQTWCPHKSQLVSMFQIAPFILLSRIKWDNSTKYNTDVLGS